MRDLIPVYHRGGAWACGQIAVFVRAAHPLTRPIPADNVVKLDGTTPLRGEIPVCGSCRHVLRRMDDWSYTPDRVLAPAATRPLQIVSDADHVITVTT